ncbi:MAG: DEAD/DEAH box helicase family protein [Isosphaeraceae bacterium]
MSPEVPQNQEPKRRDPRFPLFPEEVFEERPGEKRSQSPLPPTGHPKPPHEDLGVPPRPAPREKQGRDIQPRLSFNRPLTHTPPTRESSGASPSLTFPPPPAEVAPQADQPEVVAVGEVAKARDLIEAVRVMKRLEGERRAAGPEERKALEKFGGFGAVALRLFPDPVTGAYKSPSWEALGQELKALLTEDELASARRTVFNAFYTSPVVVGAMFKAMRRLGVPEDATVLEPGCGSGNFLKYAPRAMHFIGVELDTLSGRIARALFPQHEIRIESFKETRLSERGVDAVIGNPPFADVRMEYDGIKFALHDYFFAKGLDAVRPGGVLAFVSTHFTLDKLNGSVREYLAERADFLGAIRLPSSAFEREGTKVVTDIVFLRRRAEGETPCHVATSWLTVAPLAIEGVEVPINRYFHEHPEQVLGSLSRKDRLYGGEQGFSVTFSEDLAVALDGAIARLPELRARAAEAPPARVREVFTPPPLERHVTEGSFFIGDDRSTIFQIVEGRPEPVVYGGTKLKVNGTMTGKRLGCLIRIRDEARKVLQSQNEGWPQQFRDEARRELNRWYDLFVQQYGLVNKTTFSESSTGTIITRMPNVVRFVDDPDAVLVLALEECDPTSGTAVKAAIMLKDVVGKAPLVTAVGSAEEGLLVSLDRKGGVDLAYIASLYGAPAPRIIEELGELIYQDPATKGWLTADEYLSGNVREKLKQAEAAGPEHARNVEALRAVQPEDVLPGEIDANLGAPWIPESDIQAFAAGLFGVATSSISVSYLKKDALWSVEAGYDASTSVPATSDFGTGRANGVTLLELALNMRTPVIYDVVNHGDREERVVNQDETLAAREKQKRIKDAFRAFVFSDAERTERLVRIYNDTYNSLRLRVFDGSHLEFPGMNQSITLRSHQEDAVWRGMSGGNTLLAHVVGAGKTYTMVAIGMKRKAAGLSRKPLYVVPNHMLEQFAREAQQLYPNAKLLVATKEDLARDRRKILTAKIASSEWDGIIITHSSFERIGMSREYQAKFLKEQIAEYDLLLVDSARSSNRAQRNIIKTIEKQKARREERLKELLAEDKKDDGLVFDELGVDYLFIDEAHLFKNLETPTKMERVAGIQTSGSERAFDLYMKCRYLGELHDGHGVCFATGTPISNTMVEMMTMQRFLDPKGLRDRGIEHFDAWAATFGEVVDTMEIAPDGSSLRPRSRFAKFVNLPELQQMFRAFADVQTAEMLDLPRPRIAGNKPAVVACPMSEEQRAIQERLVARYEKLRTQKVDPREDNALAITTDGRKLALDPRLISSEVPEFHESKVNALVDRVADIWRHTEEIKGCQLVFSDLGVNPTPWGYCVYEELTAKLISSGIPKWQIASVGEAESDAKKQALFERVRQGTVRVLIGSTAKMGTGANVQRRLVALHHLDAPWKPAEVEQREGRILRQGNENKEVSIFRYVTEGSFDAYMWQALETKAKFIGQVVTGETSVRQAEDIGGQELSYAEVKAIASGNPAVLTLAEADAELQRLSTLRKHHGDEQYLARRNVRELPETIGRLKARLVETEADLATSRAHAEDAVTLRGVSCPRDKLVPVLGKMLDAFPEEVRETRRFELGQMRGLSFGIIKHRYGSPEVYLEGQGTRHAQLSRDSQGPRAVLNALERLFASYEGRAEELRRELSLAEVKLTDYRARLGTTFPHERYIEELSALRDELKVALSTSQQQEGAEPTARAAAEVASLIQGLRDSHKVEAVTPVKKPRQAPRSERPVTARVRNREGPKVLSHPVAEPEVIAVEEPRGETISQPSAPPEVPPSRPIPSRSGFRGPPEGRRRKYQKWLF